VNYFEAHKLLNEVKDGTNHPTELITHALYLTGDLEDGMRSSYEEIEEKLERPSGPECSA
jgi:hypothetical protein